LLIGICPCPLPVPVPSPVIALRGLGVVAESDRLGDELAEAVVGQLDGPGHVDVNRIASVAGSLA
jgi:hypothetical protein